MAERSRVEVVTRLRGARKFQADARTTARSVDNIGDAATRADAKIAGLNARVMLMRNALGLVKLPALVTGLGAAAGGAAALTAGVIGLASALAPLSGLMVAYPALGFAAAQGFGAWRLAMGGVTDAVGGLHESINPEKFIGLTSEAQDFALALDGMKSPIRALQSATQRGLFPGLKDSLEVMRPVLGSFQGEMQETGVSLGNVVQRFATFTRAARGDLGVLLGRNATYMERMGVAGVELTNALRHVLMAAGPLLGWLTKSSVKWADYLSHSAAAGRESGRLASLFWKTRIVASQLFRILGNVGGALFGIGVAAGPLGREMLDAIETSSAAWERWSRSATGQRDMRRYFAELKPTIWELGRLARDVVKTFVRLGATPGLAPLIAQVRTQLLPVLERLTASTATSFGPVLVDTAAKFAGLLEVLSGGVGPLTLLVQGLGLAAEAMTALVSTVPGGQEMAVALVSIGLASRVLSFAAMLTGLKAMRAGYLAVTGAIGTAKTAMGAMRAVYIAQTGVTNASTVAVLRHAAAQKIAAVATRVQAAATWALNVAQRANPIMLVVTALAALVGGIVIAYKKSETFRVIVDGLWGALKTAARWVGNAAGTIRNALGSAIDWVGDKIRGLIGLIGDLAKKIADSPIGKAAGFAGKVGGKVGGAIGDAVGAIPGLATGGVVRIPGTALVGENGPELVTFQRGARVDPLPRLAKGISQLREESVPAIGGALADSEMRSVAVTVPVHLDGRVIYEAVARVDRDRASRR